MNNKSYPADPRIRGHSVTNDVPSKIWEHYHQMVSHFFNMQCDRDRTVRKFIIFQEKMMAATLKMADAKKCGKTTPPPLPACEKALSPFHGKDVPGSGSPGSKTGPNLNNGAPPQKALSETPLKRLVLRPVPASIKRSEKLTALSPGGAILLVGKNPDLTHLLEKSLSDFNNPVFHIIPGEKTNVLGDKCYQVDLTSPESIEELRTVLNKSVPGIAGIINLMGLTRAYEKKGLLDPFISAPEQKEQDSACDCPEEQSANESLQDAGKLFLLLQVFMKDLKKSAQESEAWLINFSFMDGQFGLKKEHSFSLGQAGCVGLTKALAREYPRIKVKCIDVDPSAAPLYVIARMRQELEAFDGELEIGLDGKNRWKIDLVEKEPESPLKMPIQLDAHSVILATGGAYGIVSATLQELAARYGATLIIAGRSPLPEPESPETEKLQSFRELQHFIIEKMKQEKSPASPRVVLKQVKGILKARQIRKNLARMDQRAAAVEYHAMDVRDTGKFRSLINDIYKRWGRIDGVIHGAGVIEDKLIEAKSPEAFARVFDTKVLPATVLENALRPESLKFLVFFSSIASRFGNIGQTDYCAANEMLNKLADRLDCKWQSRVVSINWGPWDYGMVSDDLRKFFSERGIGMIPVNKGVKMFFDELNLYGKPESEVVITGSLNL